MPVFQKPSEKKKKRNCNKNREGEIMGWRDMQFESKCSDGTMLYMTSIKKIV